MRISEVIISEVKKIPIDTVFNDLKSCGSGRLYKCVNPKHTDRTPSLSVNRLDNYFKCFGCGISGDVINLYEIIYNLDFIDAVTQLANDYNINYNKKTSNMKSEANNVPNKFEFLCKYDEYLFSERAGIYEFESNYNRSDAEILAMKFVKAERLERNKIIFQEFYNYCTNKFNHGIDESILIYLIDKRKLSDVVIRDNKIFSLCNYKEVNDYMKSKFDIEELRGSGLYKENDLIFKTSHRLIIPYLENGKIIYLRGRYFNSNSNTETDRLKYFGLRSDVTNLNSIKRFYNSDIINRLQPGSKIFICEGELDCLMLQTIGFNSVAIPGVTSFPETELESLLDFDIIICFDNDEPGKQATQKLTNLFYTFGKVVSSIDLPVGIKDCSDYFIKQLTT